MNVFGQGCKSFPPRKILPLKYWLLVMLLHYVHKKVIWGTEIATFRTKKPEFLPDNTVKLVGKILNWGGPVPLVVNINIVLLNASVLKYT